MAYARSDSNRRKLWPQTGAIANLWYQGCSTNNGPKAETKRQKDQRPARVKGKVKYKGDKLDAIIQRAESKGRSQKAKVQRRKSNRMYLNFPYPIGIGRTQFNDTVMIKETIP